MITTVTPVVSRIRAIGSEDTHQPLDRLRSPRFNYNQSQNHISYNIWVLKIGITHSLAVHEKMRTVSCILDNPIPSKSKCRSPVATHLLHMRTHQSVILSEYCNCNSFIISNSIYCPGVWMFTCTPSIKTLENIYMCLQWLCAKLRRIIGKTSLWKIETHFRLCSNGTL